ncbi:MAG TPA: sulfotransferase, partial [Solirubrobacteraceae bacterium]|nr:sulfotransferase [Solirubrobacteraceae bacterium]
AQGIVNPGWQDFLDLADGIMWQGKGTFAGSHAEKAELMEAMNRHNEAVKSAIPSERLLVWSVSEGWEPLCEFLELPVPDEPLPHVNDRAEFLSRVIDSSLNVLQEWRARQGTLEPELALST